MRAQKVLIGCLVVAALAPCAASAYTVPITAQNPRAVYLRVGEGSPFGTYNGSGVVEDSRVTTVRVQVPAGDVGRINRPQPMATVGSPRITSDLDGFLFCNPGQVYIGGFYRSTSGSGWRSEPAQLTMMVPTDLLSGADRIPMSQISWTTSGNGDTGQVVPGGVFEPGATAQPLATFIRNRWVESCMSFTYANEQLKAAGTYEGTVTFTLAQP